MFVDLVKAPDFIQNNVINDTSNLHGVPRDANVWIMKLHRNCYLASKVGTINNLILRGCIAKQGDILTQTLIIMVLQLSAQDLESKFENNTITILKALVS